MRLISALSIVSCSRWYLPTRPLLSMFYDSRSSVEDVNGTSVTTQGAEKHAKPNKLTDRMGDACSPHVNLS